jgi:hypothetical protein
MGVNPGTRKRGMMKRRVFVSGLLTFLLFISTSAFAQQTEDLNDLSNIALTLNMASVGLGTVTAVGLGVDTLDGFQPGVFWSSASWVSAALGLGSGLFAAAIAEQETSKDRKTLMVLAGLAGLTVGATNFYLVWTATELPEETQAPEAKVSPFFAPDSEGRWACGIGLSVTGW